MTKFTCIRMNSNNPWNIFKFKIWVPFIRIHHLCYRELYNVYLADYPGMPGPEAWEKKEHDQGHENHGKNALFFRMLPLFPKFGTNWKMKIGFKHRKSTMSVITPNRDHCLRWVCYFFFNSTSISSRNAGQPKASFTVAKLTQERWRRKVPCRAVIIPLVLGKCEQRHKQAGGASPVLSYSFPFMTTWSMGNRSSPLHHCLKFLEEEIWATVVRSTDFKLCCFSLNLGFPPSSRALPVL